MCLPALYSRFLSIGDYEAEVYTVRFSNNFRLNSGLLVVSFMDNHSVDIVQSTALRWRRVGSRQHSKEG